jgi:hypothetical protein
MSEAQNSEPKKRGRDPEFMKLMRERASAKRAEKKTITEAQKLKAKREHEAKLKEAKSILNPEPINEPNNEDNEEVPLVVKKKTIKKTVKRYEEEDEEDDNESVRPNIYNEVRELKNMFMNFSTQMAQPPPPQPQYQPHPYHLAKRDIAQHVNKNVMNDVWRSYFPNDPSPYM